MSPHVLKLWSMVLSPTGTPPPWIRRLNLAEDSYTKKVLPITEANDVLEGADLAAALSHASGRLPGEKSNIFAFRFPGSPLMMVLFPGQVL